MTREELAAKTAVAAARKAKRAQKLADNAYLASVSSGTGASCVDSAIKVPEPAKRLKSRGGRARPRKSKKRKIPARKRAFKRLKAACKAFVFARNIALSVGLCEIAMACGGSEMADTWYHAFPQSGGNGLKYEVDSHFASCSRCNMGEYGARYRGTPEYVNRHRAILGEELFNRLAGMHGRRQISTVEANDMAAVIEKRTENQEWGTK